MDKFENDVPFAKVYLCSRIQQDENKMLTEIQACLQKANSLDQWTKQRTVRHIIREAHHAICKQIANTENVVEFKSKQIANTENSIESDKPKRFDYGWMK